MPYTSQQELPDSVRNVLPEHAQLMYKEAFNSAYDQYKGPDDRNESDGREETAHKVAWSAVKQTYKIADDGRWYKKEDY